MRSDLDGRVDPVASETSQRTGPRETLQRLAFRRPRAVIDAQKQGQFSDAWLLLAALLTLFGVFFRRDSLVLIALCLLTIVLVSWLWNVFALYGVSYRRRFSERRAFCGETIELALEVDNRKVLPLSWLRVEDTFPLDLPLEGGEIVVSSGSNLGKLSTFFSLRWYERLRRRYRLHCVQRGFYAFGPAMVESGDLFGLFRSEVRIEQKEWLIVYPKVARLADLGLPAKDPFGAIRAQRRLFEDPGRTAGVRDYESADGLRRIHWKATARRQRLQSRDYEPATSTTLIVCLNVATLARHWHGVIPEQLERAVSVAASVAAYGVGRRWPTGVIANGALPRSDQPIKVPPGRSPAQLVRILEALATVTAFATAPLEALLTTESPHLPWGATMVVVTAIVTEGLEGALVRLSEAGRPLALISLAPEAPNGDRLPGVVVYHLPPAAADQEVLPALTFRPFTPMEAWAARMGGAAHRSDRAQSDALLGS